MFSLLSLPFFTGSSMILHSESPPTNIRWQNEQTSHVPRADKTAPLPEHEHGKALEGMNASGGQSQGIKHGDTVGQGKGVDSNKS
jgi:hypothetical protein